MKIRNGFVSNSSSSSFIVIAKGNPKRVEVSDLYLNEKLLWQGQRILALGKDNETTNLKFGWEWRKYKDWTEKAVWAWLQIWYANEILTTDHYNKEFTEGVRMGNRLHPKEWLEMLTKVIKEHTDVDDIYWDWLTASMRDYDAYIDHQSTCIEDLDMINIFASEDSLARFIFNEDSYIATGNDNEEAPGGWYP